MQKLLDHVFRGELERLGLTVSQAAKKLRVTRQWLAAAMTGRETGRAAELLRLRAAVELNFSREAKDALTDFRCAVAYRLEQIQAEINSFRKQLFEGAKAAEDERERTVIDGYLSSASQLLRKAIEVLRHGV